ncbi:uncharacterized protein PAC_09054 [Phialocephala subalpina]|uniref:Hemerythrin-like domain-containing protein n=1 Tax=Phialocephala subalpina TaxID=576137 RepID=A0A1L7X2C9_9HELO|nr:uncharacterized protein PAC_09054 [Phialocephala subalpina]
MADLGKEELSEVERLAKPASTEAEILNGNEGREGALCDKMKANNVAGERKEEVKKEEEAEEPTLPKLSAADFRVYNSMAEHMDYFHNHFRHSWNLLYSACENNKRPTNLSLRQFLQTGLQFVSHLETHHSIEEAHIFPVLARKMPEFKNGRNAAELLRQHKEIHAGMEVLESYLEKCRNGETELELRVLKTKMDSWGEVLWKHLEQEVRTLGAENMRRYWSLEEMRRMPM